MDDFNPEKFAEQIAAMIGSRRTDDEIKQTLESIIRRLEALENGRADDVARPLAVRSDHPSLQRFKSLGEIADVILERMNDQKECPYEPAGKPCDNCSMCSSRGF